MVAAEEAANSIAVVAAGEGPIAAAVGGIAAEEEGIVADGSPAAVAGRGSLGRGNSAASAMGGNLCIPALLPCPLRKACRRCRTWWLVRRGIE